MRGILGSGKIYFVENLVEVIGWSGYIYCSVRQLFYKMGNLVLDLFELNIVEVYCCFCFLDVMVNLCFFVVVDGVYFKCWEYVVYKCFV